MSEKLILYTWDIYTPPHCYTNNKHWWIDWTREFIRFFAYMQIVSCQRTWMLLLLLYENDNLYNFPTPKRSCVENIILNSMISIVVLSDAVTTLHLSGVCECVLMFGEKPVTICIVIHRYELKGEKRIFPWTILNCKYSTHGMISSSKVSVDSWMDNT